MIDKARVVAIIQARLGSSRLPGKVLLPIGRATMLERVVQRVRRARMVDEVVVATTDAAKDDAVAEFCRAHDIAVYRGSEDDVLDRYFRAATEARADVVVRVTSDCPLIDPEVIDRAIDLHRRGGYDYVANNFRYTYPQGLDTEVFSLTVLAQAWREAKQPAEREHVTPYLRSRARFRLGEEANDQDLSQRHLRWTVDEPADLEFVRAVYARLDGGDGGDGGFRMADVLALLQREPSLSSLNAGIVRHEGYYLSLAKEKPVAPIESLSSLSSLSALVRLEASNHLPLVERGQGGRVWDRAGNAFLDLHMDGGNVILGHHAPVVTDSVIQSLRDGATAIAAHPLAATVAEMLTRMIPGAESARLVETPAAALRLAARLARHHTGRAKVVRCHEPSGDALGRLFSSPADDLAALVIEALALPVGGVAVSDDGFVAAARALCRRCGALLILDERRTAFRYAPGGAQAHFGVGADLTVLGSSLANGHPIGAVLGTAALLRPPTEDEDDEDASPPSPFALAAARATLQELQSKPVLGHLWEQGGRLRDGFNVLAAHYGLAQVARSHGPGPLSRIVLRPTAGAGPAPSEAFLRGCLERGLLLSDTQAVSFAHGQDDTDQVLRIYRSVLELMATGALP